MNVGRRNRRWFKVFGGATGVPADRIWGKLRLNCRYDEEGSRGIQEKWRRTRSSSPARSPARSTRRPCRRICRSRPSEIAEAAIGAAEAGAAIVHLHARDPETGRPDQTPEAFARFLPRIKQRTNAVINLTTGGAPNMRVEERCMPAATFKPEVASLNMGSMNFGLFPMLDRYQGLQARLGAALSRRHARPHLPQHLQGHRIRADAPAATTARASSSSATTSAISTTSRTSSSAAWSSRRCSCRRCSASSAASAPIRKTSMHMRRTADRLFGATTIAGRCSAPAAIRCRSPRWRPRWAATCGSASRTRCGSGPGKLAESNAAAGPQGAPDHRGAGARDRDAGRGTRRCSRSRGRIG